MRPILFAECFFDTFIIKTLTERRRWRQTEHFWHVKGTQLFNSMRNRANNEITVGFLDKNKKLHDNDYMKNFTKSEEQYGVQWHKHITLSNQHILYIDRGVEEWFLEAAGTVSLVHNGIPTLNDFKKKTKTITIDEATKKFVKNVIKANPSQILALSQYIDTIFGEQIHSLSTE